jgi:hypothetical protein
VRFIFTAAAVSLSLVAFSPAGVSAQIIAVEQFIYPNSSNLDGGTGGSGWRTSPPNETGWMDSQSSITVILPSLYYEDGLGQVLDTAGNRATYAGAGSGANRFLANQLGTVGSTAYMSILMKATQRDNNVFGGVTLSQTNLSRVLSIGTIKVGSGANAQSFWGVTQGGSTDQASTKLVVVGDPNDVTDEVVMVVVRFIFQAANTYVSMAVNPILNGVYTPDANFATLNGGLGVAYSPFTFDRVALDESGQTTIEFDELRFGVNFIDVSRQVPEPSTVLTCAFAGLAAAWAYRRRRVTVPKVHGAEALVSL